MKFFGIFKLRIKGIIKIIVENSQLKDIGFKKVSRYDWRDTEHAYVDDFSQAYYPHMDKENGIQHSLNVEAIK